MNASRFPLSLSFLFVFFALILALIQLHASIKLSHECPNAQSKIDLLEDSPSLESENLNNKAEDRYGTNCEQLLQDFRNGKIPQMEKDPGWAKSFVTRTITPKPFYWSTRKPDLDAVRGLSCEKGLYYEKQLTLRVQETFDKK